jgi:hypothetical protein
VTWRWRLNPDELYARTPAWDAFVDIMVLNQQGKSNLEAGHKMVNPPMVGEKDLRGQVDMTPGGWTWVSRMDKRPLPAITGILLPYGTDQQDRMEKKIKEYFHTDFFLMLYQAAFNKVDLTATQVIGMEGEQAAVLGTRIGRYQTEGIDPIMDRAFNIEYRAGRMPEPPDILLNLLTQGINIEIDYLGLLPQAQRKLFKIQGFRAGLEIAASVASIFPETKVVVNADETMREGLNIAGFSQKLIRSDKDIEEIRKIRKQEMELAKALEAGEQVSKIIPKLSKEVEAGSPLDLLAGGEKTE